MQPIARSSVLREIKRPTDEGALAGLDAYAVNSCALTVGTRSLLTGDGSRLSREPDVSMLSRTHCGISFTTMRQHRLLLVVSSATILLDQITKLWAVNTLSLPKAALAEGLLPLQSRTIVVIEGWCNFRLWADAGASWGVLGGLPDSFKTPIYIITGLVGIAVAVYLYRLAKGTRRFEWGVALILGSVLGELIDRVRLGYAIQFIDLHHDNFHWPTFNVTDIAYSVGLGLVIIQVLSILFRRSKAKPSTP